MTTTKLKVYISGPMTGYPDLNFPAFDAAAKAWRDRGYTVVSPHEIDNDQTDWHACMRRDLTEMMTCDMIVMLHGWIKSRGATLELHVATQVGMAVWIDQ